MTTVQYYIEAYAHRVYAGMCAHVYACVQVCACAANATVTGTGHEYWEYNKCACVYEFGVNYKLPASHIEYTPRGVYQ